MKLNLKYSDNLDRDYKKLSKGRKNYVKKMAGKRNLTISKYLDLKYGSIIVFNDVSDEILDAES
tara:strand:- start:155 stop:346 length:192 start_codon:yes stop_codon:yes gene_type:complete